MNNIFKQGNILTNIIKKVKFGLAFLLLQFFFSFIGTISDIFWLNFLQMGSLIRMIFFLDA